MLVRSLGDTDATTLLEKAAPPAVKLAVNDILRPHSVHFFGSDQNLLQVLKEEVGVIPHSYQGKEGNFEGPQCNTILNKFSTKLRPYFLENEEEHPDGFLFVSVFESLKKVKDSVFGLQLAENVEDILEEFSTILDLAHIGARYNFIINELIILHSSSLIKLLNITKMS